MGSKQIIIWFGGQLECSAWNQMNCWNSTGPQPWTNNSWGSPSSRTQKHFCVWALPSSSSGILAHQKERLLQAMIPVWLRTSPATLPLWNTTWRLWTQCWAHKSVGRFMSQDATLHTPFMAVRTPNPSMNASVNPTVLAPGGEINGLSPGAAPALHRRRHQASRLFKPTGERRLDATSL